VIDFGWVYAGPVLGALLADMGAEVIKIETRHRTDTSRRGRPITGENIAAGDAGLEPDIIPLFHCLNRNKLGITVDMNQPAGVAILKRLVATADIVVENFTPRVLRKFDLHYEALRAIKPDLIMCSITAAGQFGPLRDLASYAPSVSSLAGMESMAGYPGERVLGMMGLNYGDPMVGLWASILVFAAIHHRNQTGEGQYIDISQFECTTALVGEALADYAMNRRVATTRGNQNPVMAPHGAYRCAGDDKWITIACATEEEWRALARAMGDPEWAFGEEFGDKYARLTNWRALNERIEAWTRDQDANELFHRLQAAGVACAPVYNIEDQFADPHYHARDLYPTVDHPLVGTEFIYGLPWKLSASPGAIARPAPNIGQHNGYVFRELLGMTPGEIEALGAEGALY
jgi:benzylsuccinate CoA-transferase BbsF subunit